MQSLKIISTKALQLVAPTTGSTVSKNSSKIAFSQETQCLRMKIGQTNRNREYNDR